jgi:threonyl-tRNA synthetase
MIYQWLRPDITTKDIETETGLRVKRVTKGLVVTGYEDRLMPDNRLHSTPIFKEGIEIEFDDKEVVTSQHLSTLDAKFPELKRAETKVE